MCECERRNPTHTDLNVIPGLASATARRPWASAKASNPHPQLLQGESSGSCAGKPRSSTSPQKPLRGCLRGADASRFRCQALVVADRPWNRQGSAPMCRAAPERARASARGLLGASVGASWEDVPDEPCLVPCSEEHSLGSLSVSNSLSVLLRTTVKKRTFPEALKEGSVHKKHLKAICKPYV